MKIAVLSNEYPSPNQTFVRDEIRGLEGAGFRVLRVAIRGARGRLVDRLDVAEGWETVRLLSRWGKPLAPFRVGRVRAAMGAARALMPPPVGDPLKHLAYAVEAAMVERVIEGKGIEWIHVHHGTNSAGVAAIVRAMGGPPWSVTIHGPPDLYRPRALGLVRKLAWAEYAIAINDDCERRLRALMPGREDRVRLVRYGVTRGFVEAGPARAVEEPRLTCVARLSANKEHHLIVRAVAEVRRRVPGVRVEFVGEGPMKARVRALVRELGVEENVEFVGWKDGEGVRESLRRSRGMVMASSSEGTPLAIVEALAMGKPVVATDVGGIGDIVRAGKTGWLVESGSVEGLSAAILEAVTARGEELERLGAQGRALVLERHDPARHIEALGG